MSITRRTPNGWRIAPAGGTPERITSHMGRVSHPVLLDPRTLVYLATSPEVEGVTGEYFSGKRVRRSARQSHDLAAGERLWHESERLVGLPVTP